MISEERITVHNMAKLTEEACEYCLFKEGDDLNRRKKVDGIVFRDLFGRIFLVEFLT